MRCLRQGLSNLTLAAEPSCGLASTAAIPSTAPLPALSALYSRLAGSTTALDASVISSAPAGSAAQLPVAASAASAAMPTQQRCSYATSAQQQGKRQSQRRPPMGRPATAPPMQSGIVHILASRNNTIFTLTDEAGDTKAW